MWTLYPELDYFINFTVSMSSDPLHPPFFSGLQRVGKAVDRPREIDNIAVRGGYKGEKIFARSFSAEDGLAERAAARCCR